MIKTGDLIRCIEPMGHLTRGEVYFAETVFFDLGDWWVRVCIGKDIANYYARRFETVVEIQGRMKEFYKFIEEI